MNAPIYMIGGTKGGVGKSIVTMSILDYLTLKNVSVCLVETDTGNPDVWKTYKDEVTSYTLDTDIVDGWMQLVTICHEDPARIVVVNTAARNMTGILKFGDTLTSMMQELDRALIVPWVINKQRDSLDLLADFCDAIPAAKIHIVMNGYWGERHKFGRYDRSGTKTRVEAAGGKSVYIDELSDIVADEIYNDRVSIARGMREMPIGNRAELTRWRNMTHKAIKEIL